MSLKLRSLIVLSLLVSSVTFAAPAAKPQKKRRTPANQTAVAAPKAVDDYTALPLDTLQEKIVKTNKSKIARSLKKAWDALESGKHQQAIKFASEVGSSSELTDFSYWIQAAAHYGAGLKRLAAKQYAEALKSGETSAALSMKIEPVNAYSPLAKHVPREVGLAEALQGDALAGRKKWAQSQKAFESAFQRLSSNGALGLVRPASVTNYAQSCMEKKGPLCDAWIKRLGSYYPKHSEEMRALLKVYPDATERTKAAPTGKTGQNYRSSTDLDLVAFETAMNYYLDGKFSAAIQEFRKFGDEFPNSQYRFRARYWLAQAMTHEQDHENAQKAYTALQQDSPLTYYGLLSALTAGKSFDSVISATVPLAAPRDPLLLPNELMRISRAEKLIAEKAYDLATLELKDFRARDALSSPFIMYLAALNSLARNHSTAFSLISELIARGYDGAASSTVLRMIFPQEHYDLIKKYATQYELDPVLLLSLIKQESAFDTAAISSSGALGLMQLMPATASDTDSKIERADLIQAENNIRVGAKYLKQLLVRFNGNIALALAGYNAGPNAADRWYKASGGKRGLLEFIETIPYKETREYVSSIIRNYIWYSRRINPEDAPKGLGHFWITQPAITTPQNGSA